jgi:CubicO group peptidase (beta-lactamase class C family)
VDARELTSLLDEHAARHSLPGAALGVLRGGDATVACHGFAEVATGTPIGPETRFSLGSLTKPIVATVIARLADAGRLSFDDPVASRVPELRGSPWAEDATVRDLLANSSGLPLRSELEFGFDARRGRDEGALARLTAAAAGREPRAPFWSYSNVGWCVLGRVIETVTNAVWEESVRTHLLEPAGMETEFATAPGVADRVHGHEVTPDGVTAVEPLTARAYGPAGTTGVATVDDLLRFAALHLEDASLAALRTVHADVSILGWLDGWGLGWASFDWGGPDVWGWDGLVPGERSILRLLPEHEAALVLTTNAGSGRAMYRSLFGELVPSLFGSSFPPLRLEPPSGAGVDLARYAGVYAWPDREVRVTDRVDGLLLEADGGEYDAVPLDARTFLVGPADPDNPTVTFGAFDEAGRPGVLYLMLWGLPRIDA